MNGIFESMPTFHVLYVLSLSKIIPGLISLLAPIISPSPSAPFSMGRVFSFPAPRLLGFLVSVYCLFFRYYSQFGDTSSNYCCMEFAGRRGSADTSLVGAKIGCNNLEFHNFDNNYYYNSDIFHLHNSYFLFLYNFPNLNVRCYEIFCFD